MKLLSALRPPAPRRVIQHNPAQQPGHAVVRIASGYGPDSAAQLLALNLALDEAGPLVVPELGGHQRNGSSPHVARAVLRSLAAPQVATLAIPPAPRDIAQRWRNLATAQSARFLILGTSGWTRLEFTSPAFRFTSIDVPSELIDAEPAVGLLRVERFREPFEYWPAIVHPHTVLRATAGSERDSLIVELGAARRMVWLLDLTPGGGVAGSDATAILATTTDIVAAELCLLAAQQLSWIRAGYEERGPWEHPRVQAACQLGLGIDGGHALVLRTPRDDDPAERMAERIARRLDCLVEVSE